jgi:hypothetical protein
MISALISTADNVIVNEDLIPMQATCGNKPVPVQATGSALTIIDEPNAEDAQQSGYINVGPVVNGYGRVVPPLHSIETMVNSL